MTQTILILAAQPKHTPEARLNEEIEAIRDSLRGSTAYEIRTLLVPSQERVLAALLEHRPSVVHFCGHGLEGEGILFEDVDGTARAVGGTTLAEFFAAFGEHLRCVVLNACYSEPQAAAVSRHVPFVVGSDGRISTAAAIRYSRAFYRVLGANGDIERAHALGRNAIQWQGDEAVAALHRGPGAADPGENRVGKGKEVEKGGEGHGGWSRLRTRLLWLTAMLGLAAAGLAAYEVIRSRPPEEFQLHVSVLTEEGFPTPEAILEASPGEALRTRSGWLVRVPRASGRGETRLTAYLEDEPLRATVVLDLETWDRRTYDLKLVRYEVGVRGGVVDPQNRPVAGATVSIDGVEAVLSDENGFFKIPDTGRTTGAPVQLLVRKAGYEPREQAHAAGDQPVNIEISREEPAP